MREAEPAEADVLVIGGGISGLVVAFRLASQGRSVLLVERSERLGGVIRTERNEGFLVDWGPNTVLATAPEIGRLMADLGLEDQVIWADSSSQRRFVLRDGRLRQVPTGPLALLATRLFGWRAKLALVGEPFVPPAPPQAAETLAQLVLRRLGPEFLAYAINPFVAGVYAGRPEELEVKTAFPRLWQLEQQYGSLIGGAIRGARERRRRAARGEVARDRARLFSFRNGMQTLTDALAARLAGRVRTSTRVVALELQPSPEAGEARTRDEATSERLALRSPEGGVGWGHLNMLAVTGDHECKVQCAKCKVQDGRASRLSATIDHRPSTITYDRRSTRFCSDGRGNGWRARLLGPKGEEEVFARAVVPAVPARELTALLPRPELSGLADLPYPPVAEVFFGFAGEPGGRALDGFGFLVPEVEKRRILGTLWLSSLFPGRVPAGGAAMTTFVGGRRQPELASLPDDELAELVLDELSELTGLVRTPDLIRIERFPEAIPQYTVGHRERLDRLALLEKNEAGLFIGSNVAGGISVGDRIRFGTELAERVRIYLEGGGGR